MTGARSFVRSMTLGYPTRVKVGILLMLLFAVVSQAQLLRRVIETTRASGQPDEITRYEARFRALKRALPARGVVGYVSDLEREGVPLDSDEARQSFKRYLLTQYALSPLVVVRSVEPDLVVGNFHTSGGHQDSAPPPGLALVQDFGDGVALFSRTTK